jgi:hypothetical protein
MTHHGSLGTQRVADNIHDIRGTIVRGPDGEKLSEISDLILDHDTMEIRYLVMDSGGWLETKTFLLPADRISADENHHDGLVTGVTRQQIANAPPYDKKSLRTEDEWKKYEQEFKKYWDEKPVMHIKSSDRIVTPPEEPTPAQANSIGSGNRQINAAELFPQRMTDVFSDPTPSGGKVTLRPSSVARAEDASRGVTLL